MGDEKCSIYRIDNQVNGKVYIGQTWSNLLVRFSKHKSKGAKTCIKLINAFNKYGRENFTINLIVSCSTQQEADCLESFWIKVYDSIGSGYNIREGGSHGKLSQSTKDKISNTNIIKGIKPPKSKLGRKRTGSKMSTSHKNKLSKIQATKAIDFDNSPIDE